MASTEPQFQFLYLSYLAPSFDFGAFKSILGVSRSNNPGAGISGALVFDGERFCQLLDGPRDAVESLMARLHVDPRHVNLLTLHTGINPGRPLLPGWTNGYCGANDLDVFVGGEGLRGAEALAAFVLIVAGSDMSD